MSTIAYAGLGEDVSSDEIEVDAVGPPELDRAAAYDFSGRHTHNVGPDFAQGDQAYRWNSHGDLLAITGRNAATQAGFSIHSADADGTDDVAYHAFSVGAPGAANSESLFLGWDATASRYLVQPTAAGTGTVQALELGPVSGQIILRTDGDWETKTAVTETNDGMTANPETATEDAFLTIHVGASTYQIPLYAA